MPPRDFLPDSLSKDVAATLKAAVNAPGGMDCLLGAHGTKALRQWVLRWAAQGHLSTKRMIPPEVQTLVHNSANSLWELPQGWKLCRLGDVFDSVRGGGTPSKQNPEFWGGDIPWASVKDLGFGVPLWSTQDHITPAGLAAGSHLASVGDILICTRMGLGKIGQVMREMAFNQDLKAVRLVPEVHPQYFINYFKTLAIHGTGVTVAGIRQEELLAFEFPLPPLAEQQRIVEQVASWMRWCDALDAAAAREASLHARKTKRLLEDVSRVSPPVRQHTAWKLLEQQWHGLLDRPLALDEFEQTALQMAIQGWHGGPMPAGWRWTTLGEVVDVVRGITFPATDKHREPGPGRVPCLRTTNVQHTLEWDDLLYVDAAYVRRPEQRLRLNDLVMSIANSRELVGKLARVETHPPANASFGGFLCVLRPRFVDARFTMAVLRTQAVRNLMTEGASQTTNLANISVAKLNKLPFPLPPMEVQTQIADQLDSLLTVVAALRQKMARQKQLQSRLLEALGQEFPAVPLVSKAPD